MAGKLGPFQHIEQAYNGLAAETPVDHDILVATLGNAATVGEAQVNRQSLGAVNYANVMIAMYDTALSLNEASNVVPPLSPEEVASFTEKRDGLQVLAQANGETGTAPTPTDLGSAPTTAKKGK